MPKFRMERQEMGEQYTIYEAEAANKEEAKEIMLGEDEETIVSRRFKQRDAVVLYIKEISEQ